MSPGTLVVAAMAGAVAVVLIASGAAVVFFAGAVWGAVDQHRRDREWIAFEGRVEALTLRKVPCAACAARAQAAAEHARRLSQQRASRGEA